MARKYPLKKEALAAARKEIKESRKAHIDVQREQNKIKTQIKKDNPVKSYWAYRAEAERQNNAAQRKQDVIVREHTKKAKKELSPLLKELRKKEAVIEKHQDSLRQIQNEKYKVARVKRDAKRLANLEKKMKYTDEQKEFMAKSRKSFIRTKKSFIMYKKAFIKDSTGNLCTPVMITLDVPQNAKRVCGSGYGQSEVMSWAKIRVDVAVVRQINIVHGCDLGEETKLSVYANHDKSFSYKTGETITPQHAFDTDTTEVCGSGIHGYLGIPAAIKH